MHPCPLDTFLVIIFQRKLKLGILFELPAKQTIDATCLI